MGKRSTQLGYRGRSRSRRRADAAIPIFGIYRESRNKVLSGAFPVPILLCLFVFYRRVGPMPCISSAFVFNFVRVFLCFRFLFFGFKLAVFGSRKKQKKQDVWRPAYCCSFSCRYPGEQWFSSSSLPPAHPIWDRSKLHRHISPRRRTQSYWRHG